MDHELLHKETSTLLQYNQELQNIYLEVIDKGQPADFFSIVKPFADKVKVVLDRWEESALKWVKTDKPKYFHRQQIDNMVENITTVSVQAFFPDTKGKRFKELIRSNQYTLENILQLLQK
ncbi:YppE family protein [Bacillus sp. DJP31]|uniref:YppE family protein n=1 Tax=Bacillus sp. DJP31 TaxID=3409789 RepID=UPI003BB72701